jgi:hypothetical protein
MLKKNVFVVLAQDDMGSCRLHREFSFSRNPPPLRSSGAVFCSSSHGVRRRLTFRL